MPVTPRSASDAASLSDLFKPSEASGAMKEQLSPTETGAPPEPDEAPANSQAVDRQPESDGLPARFERSPVLRRKLFIDPLLSEIRAAGYLTNDLLELSGSLRGPVKQLKINGVRPLGLTRPEFIILVVLAAHSRTLGGLPVHRRVEGEPYLAAKEIMNIVESWARDDSAMAWNATFEAVHRSICKLRKKLMAAGTNPNLIETRSRDQGGGYRLSTAPVNVEIRLRQ